MLPLAAGEDHDLVGALRRLGRRRAEVARPGKLGLYTRNLGLRVATGAADGTRIEEADRDLRRVRCRAAVRHLRNEVRIHIAKANAAERRSAAAAEAAATRRTDAEERHVVQDVAALVQTDLTTGEDLSPSSTSCQVHLTHVDLRTSLRAVAEVVMHAARIVDLRSKTEVHAEIDAAFFALRFERSERRHQTAANSRRLLAFTRRDESARE